MLRIVPQRLVESLISIPAQLSEDIAMRVSDLLTKFVEIVLLMNLRRYTKIYRKRNNTLKKVIPFFIQGNPTKTNTNARFIRILNVAY